MTSGIYQILNKINGHLYIGSSVNIEQRWMRHRKDLKKNNHHSSYLQRAWNKHGASAFEFSIVETCFIFALIFREQHYITNISPVYNISPTAGSNTGVKRTPEARAKISAANKGVKRGTPTLEHRAAISVANKGKRTGMQDTPETRAKKSEAHKGRKKGSPTSETRAKISEAVKRWRAKKKVVELVAQGETLR